MLLPCQTGSKSSKRIPFYLFKVFRLSVNILEYVIFIHTCKSTRQSFVENDECLKRQQKNILNFQILVSLTFGQRCKLNSVINYGAFLRLNDLAALFYPTHSCQANPPKTSIFICHFSKTSFLTSYCPQNCFQCFCLAFKALCGVAPPEVLPPVRFSTKYQQCGFGLVI